MEVGEDLAQGLADHGVSVAIVMEGDFVAVGDEGGVGVGEVGAHEGEHVQAGEVMLLTGFQEGLAGRLGNGVRVLRGLKARSRTSSTASLPRYTAITTTLGRVHVILPVEGADVPVNVGEVPVVIDAIGLIPGPVGVNVLRQKEPEPGFRQE